MAAAPSGEWTTLHLNIIGVPADQGSRRQHGSHDVCEAEREDQNHHDPGR